MSSRKRDYRVWSQVGRARNVNGVLAIQNPDRHDPERKAGRKEYLKAWWEKYIADAPNRRAVTLQQACMKCWQLKAVDASDGLGGFTPDNRSASGWTKLCRMCRAEIAKERRNNKRSGGERD